ncbi:MAG TPA: AraC family transcriptional regulator [Pyrinomonadaceae bacterium]|nr:AraC family transcriptional regulator [Pyrinomonadaceae bacterium]
MYSESLTKQPVSKITRPTVGLKSNGFAQDKLFNPAIRKPTDRRVQTVVMLLESNWNKQIALPEIAQAVNLSPSRLAHLFKSEMNLSMQQYLTRLRLAKAKRQLETSFLSVKEIAAAVGFSSVTRFVACFKSVVGFTPGQYRKQLSNAAYHDAERSW